MLLGIIIAFLYILIAFLLIFLILLQTGRGGGIAAAFGGATVENIFGSTRGNVLTRVTAILAILFMIFSIILVRMGPSSLIKSKGAPKGERPAVAQPTTPPEQQGKQ
ncbi:MAG: preprotein translocase subunit SecG [bacterium]